MKNLMAFALALTALATGAFAEETVEWNLGKVAVVAPKKPKAEMRAAVEELRYHLGLVAGSEFSDEAPFRFVFRRPKDAASLKPFESRYRIDGRTVWFWGDDGGSDAALDWGDNRGKTSRKRHGTRFAVSLFLENELGVRWLWPGAEEPVSANPGPGQLSLDDWCHLVCVEPAVLWKDAAVVLPPGGRHEISFEISTKTR